MTFKHNKMDLLNQYKGQILVFCLTCLGAIPLKCRILLGRFFGFLFSLFPTLDKQIATLQMDLFLSDQGGSKHLPSVYANLGQTVFESLNLRPYLAKGSDRITCNDLEYLQSVANQNNPVIAFSAHTGNWDLMAAYLIKQGFSFSAIGKRAKSASFQAVLADIRSGYGIRTIWRDDAGGMKQIVREIKNGNILSALIDQDTTVSSIHVPFFGMPASSPSSLISLGKKTRAVMISVLIFRTGFDEYCVFAEPLDSSLKVEGILTEFNERLEKYIRKFPDQWVWFHKRWRTNINGERPRTKEYIECLKEQRRDVQG